MKKPSSPATLHLTLDKKSFFLFTPLLQRGVRVPARVGCSQKSLLEDQFGLNPEYLKERVKTVFLDGKPVDDWDATSIQDGAVLALSAAMPGLAGATLRRGGFFAGMRSQITHREKESPILAEEGWVVVKLFNLLIPELGPLFLERGILLLPEEFAEFRNPSPEEFWKECQEIRVDGEKIDAARLKILDDRAQGRGFLLSVHFPGWGNEPALFPDKGAR